MPPGIKRLFLVVCAGFYASFVSADEPGSLAQQVQAARSITEPERQVAVIRGAQLSYAQAAAFAPIYREYRAQVADVNQKMVALLEDYSNHYDALTDAQARSLTRDWLAIERKRIELKTDFAKKFEQALPAVEVARVLQIENRLDLLQMIGASAVIPLAKP